MIALLGALLATMVLPTTDAAQVDPSTRIILGSAVPATRAAPDARAVEVGVRVRATMPGAILALRYYRGRGNDGTHVGSVWSGKGELLARATYSDTGLGWQKVTLSTPLLIAAGQEFIVSYHAPQGHYAATRNAFPRSKAVGPLTLPKGAGVYRYGESGFPRQTYKNTNYWVDLDFRPGFSGGVPPESSDRRPSLSRHNRGPHCLTLKPLPRRDSDPVPGSDCLRSLGRAAPTTGGNSAPPARLIGTIPPSSRSSSGGVASPRTATRRSIGPWGSTPTLRCGRGRTFPSLLATTCSGSASPQRYVHR